MSREDPRSIRHRRELYSSLSRVQALAPIWEDRDRVAASRGLSPARGYSPSQLSDEELARVKESVANVWAGLELEALQGSLTDIEVAEGMAAILQPYRYERGLLNEISTRVDKLLSASPSGQRTPEERLAQGG